MVSDKRRKRGVDETVRSHVTLRDVTEHHFVKEQHEDRRELHLRRAGSACRYRDYTYCKYTVVLPSLLDRVPHSVVIALKSRGVAQIF